MHFEEIDYLQQARDRITYQFKESPNLDTLIKIWLEGYQDLQKTLVDIHLINDIDTAKGVQLENIGEIVGQPRELVNVSSTGYFGFEEDPGAKSFGSVKNASGGLYFSLDNPAAGNIELADELYSLFVKAKIRNNNTGSTPEEVIESSQAVFETDTVELYEATAQIGLYIGRAWNDESLTVFPGLDETDIASRLLPKPVGVSIDFLDFSLVDSISSTNDWVTASDELDHTANNTFFSNMPA